MTSKLLQAVVGVGIAVGAGCGGESRSTADEPAAPESSPFDPFCDAAWPTTKGNPALPACVDPRHQCDSGSPIFCYKEREPNVCDYRSYSGFCIDGAWQCRPDMVEISMCRCLGEAPPGQVCTETGWGPVSGGAG